MKRQSAGERSDTGRGDGMLPGERAMHRDNEVHPDPWGEVADLYCGKRIWLQPDTDPIGNPSHE